MSATSGRGRGRGSHRLTQEQVRTILARYGAGESVSSIARSLGCVPGAVHYHLKRTMQKVTRDRATADTPAGCTMLTGSCECTSCEAARVDHEGSDLDLGGRWVPGPGGVRRWVA